MSKNTPHHEQIKQIDNRINELKEAEKKLKKNIEAYAKSNYRKQRARRLIEKGALAEKYFEIQNLDSKETEELFKIFAEFIKKNKPNRFKK